MPQAFNRQVNDVRSEMMRLVALHGVDNRAELAHRVGISASAAGGHVDFLLAAGALTELGVRATGGRGRPVYQLGVAKQAGVVIAAEIGVTGARLAVGNLGAGLRAAATVEFDIADGPTRILALIADHLDALLADKEIDQAKVLALVIALPGPVDDHNGTTVRPSIMPGWDGYPVSAEMSARFGCPVEVHNDVNMMAAAEALALTPAELPMIYLKIGSGLGCGIVLPDGSILHGKDGGAGDIAHIPAPGRPNVLCACGNVGCMEAVVSTRAILRQLDQDMPGLLADAPRNSQTLLNLLQRGDPHALRATRDAAAVVGEAVVLLVHLFNPATIYIGGLVATATEDVVATIRGIVYQRALPLVTRSLKIASGPLRQNAGLTGVLRRAIEMAFSADNIAQLSARSESISDGGI